MVHRKLLVLDLDETLIHATEEESEHAPAFEYGTYSVHKRPHLEVFLQSAFAEFDVGIWTSAGADYAHYVVSRIMDPGDLKFLWASKRCTLRRDFTTGDYYPLKRLSKLKSLGYRLEHIIAVDDSPEKHRANYGNLIRVSEFTGDVDDAELPRLLQYLRLLAAEPNVRRIEKRDWRLKISNSPGSLNAQTSPSMAPSPRTSP
ncbi:HAD family hydrolase [Piscinibacter terrae]|nr:HAD family hydrolase [Albitalea terrae]